jgi:hypothetical protein
MKKKSFSVSVTPTQYEYLKRKEAMDTTSVSEIVRRALDEYVKNNPLPHSEVKNEQQ